MPSAAVARLVEGDFDTPEQHIGDFQMERPWESCMTMLDCRDGGWSYRPEGRTRTVEECLTMLINCAGGDGNLLLNVGPLPAGEIDPPQVAVLKEIGRWLKQNGGSIYGTRGGPWKPTKNLASTRQGNTIYLHVLPWPGEKLVLPNLPAKVVRAKVLTGGKAEFEQQGDRLILSVPPANRQTIDTIIQLDLDQSAMDLRPIAIPSPSQTSEK
jgi:alpha-L-fucosidase